MKESSRFALIIDPQVQANRWIREMLKTEKLTVMKPTTNASILNNTIAESIQQGRPVLIEGVEEKLDPMFESLLDQNKTMEGTTKMMKFLDKFYPLNEKFRFYLTTKLSRPHYPPEICAKVTLLNFTVTPEGLEDQLVNIVVAKENAAMETKRQNMIKKYFDLMKKQKDTEEKILDLLSNQTGGNILDDEELIATLSESKKDGKEIDAGLKDIEINKKKFKKIADSFREVGFRISNLFFWVTDMANVEPMYQFSLDWFIELFKKAIDQEPKNPDSRVRDINKIFINFLFVRVWRSLFEKDKLLFSFLIFLKKLYWDKITNNQEIRKLLLNAVAKDTDKPNPCSDWLSDKQWNTIADISKEFAFHGICEDFDTYKNEWKKIYESTQPQDEVYPNGWATKLNPIQRIILLKIIRLDKVIPAIQNEIKIALGNNFVEYESFSLDNILNDSNHTTPIICILSSGSDPLAEIFKLGKKNNLTSPVQIISLGQGQDKAADDAISYAKEKGCWVVLQNCHLCPGYLTKVEKEMEEEADPSYRIWLTSMPSERFPVTILQNGVKVTNEPPRGIKSNLLKNYLSFENKYLEDCNNLPAWKKLIFGLSFFHSIILERRKFGALGWNTPYQFSQMDMNISINQLRIFLNEYDDIQWKALLYMTAEANYGGRVTDPMDRRLINVILRTYFRDEVMDDNYKFSESGIYFAPPIGTLESYIEYIKNDLPLNDEPEVFGMHDNANITSGINDTSELLGRVLELQPQTSAGGASSMDQMIMNT